MYSTLVIIGSVVILGQTWLNMMNTVCFSFASALVTVHVYLLFLRDMVMTSCGPGLSMQLNLGN